MNTIVSGPRVLLRAPCLFQVAVAEALLASGRADLAARFDAYVADAALFLESSGAATSADEARLDRVRAIRDFVVEIRRGMPV